MNPLGGRSVVVTRPERQAEALATSIEAAGGRALRFPALEIIAESSAALHTLLSQLATFHMAVFVSRNAVEHGLAAAGPRWPANVAVAAIGEGTRRALEVAGLSGVIAPPSGADSEALLNHPQLRSVAGKRVLIVRGVGGREHLAAMLRERGARVEYAECYRRVRPQLDPRPLIDAWTNRGVDAVTVSSSEGLANLDATLGEPGRPLLRSTPLFVPHARVAEAAHALGIGEVEVAGVGDEALLASLVAYFGRAG